MLAILEGVFGFFVKTRIGNALGLLLAACLALTLWTNHVASHAKAKAVQQVTHKIEQATDKEHDRRIDVLIEGQKELQKRMGELAVREQANAARQKEIDRASHAYDSRPCLAADSVQRLDQIR